MWKIKRDEDEIITAEEAYKIMDSARKEKCAEQLQNCLKDISEFAKDGREIISFSTLYKQTIELLKDLGYKVTYNKEYHIHNVSWDKPNGENINDKD